MGKMNPYWLIFFRWVGSTPQPGILPCPSYSKVLIDLGSGVEVLVLHNPLGDLDEHLAQDGASQLGTPQCWKMPFCVYHLGVPRSLNRRSFGKDHYFCSDLKFHGTSVLMVFDSPQSNHFLWSLVPSTLFLLVGPSKYDDVLHRITPCSMVSLQEHLQHALIESIHRTLSYLVPCRTWSKCSVILWIIEVWNWIRRPYIVGVEGQRAFGGTPKHDVCVCALVCNKWIIMNCFLQTHHEPYQPTMT